MENCKLKRETPRIFRVLRDSRGILGNTRVSRGFQGIQGIPGDSRDSWSYQRIPLASWQFQGISGILGILQDPMDSLGFQDIVGLLSPVTYPFLGFPGDSWVSEDSPKIKSKEKEGIIVVS